MLWIRGLIFTALVPLVIGVWIPAIVDPLRRARGGAWDAGWALIAAGTAMYALSLVRFLSSGGTPAIFFTRALRALIGEEPHALVQGWLYRVTRNPMYVGVLSVVFGQAIVFVSQPIAVYGAALWLFFHVTVVLLEEPHLRELHGASYDEYCRRVPRWLVTL